MPKERWRAFYEGAYEVSDLGRVRRAKPGPGTWAGRVLKANLVGGGYLQVPLQHKGKKVAVSLHKLVAKAFLGPCPIGKEVDHVNGVKTECAVSNLEYVTRVENTRRAYELGLKPVGSEIYNAKLTESAVRELRRLGKQVGISVLAKRFGVTYATIWQVFARRTWKHVA